MDEPLSGKHSLLLELREAYRPQGRLWIDDLLVISVDGEEAGYMVLSHVPAARLAQVMPRAIVDYAAYQKGHLTLRVGDDELPAAIRRHVGLPPEAGNSVVARVCGTCMGRIGIPSGGSMWTNPS